MKNVIRITVAIVLVVVVLDRLLGTLFDYAYRDIRVGEAGGKINAYLAQPEAPYLTIFGNSRMKFLMIPDSIPVQHFNLSHNGMSLPFQTGLASVLEQHQKLSKVWIVLVEPKNFVYETHDRNTSLDAQHLRYFYDKNPLVTDYINDISRFEHVKYWFQLYRYNGRSLNLLTHLVRSYRGESPGSGYEELSPTPRDSLTTVTDASLAPTFWGDKLSPNSVRFIKDIVDISKRNNIKLICVTSPYFYDTDGHFTVGQQYLDKYLASEGIPYIDYSRVKLPGLEDPKVWRDAIHPNVLGARIVMHDLKNRLQQLGVFPPAGQQTPAQVN